MGVFNLDELKSEQQSNEDNKNACIAWCTQAVKDFLPTAKELGLRHREFEIMEGQEYKLVESPMNTRVVKGSFFKPYERYCEYYPLILNNGVKQIVRGQFSCIITITGNMLISGKEQTASSMGAFIAKAVDYDQKAAESLFKLALKGEPVSASF